MLEGFLLESPRIPLRRLGHRVMSSRSSLNSSAIVG